MKEIINLAIIGLDCRRMLYLKDCLVHIKDINIVGLCDLYEDRVKDAADFLMGKLGTSPQLQTTDYHKI